jgi:arginine decarboxylase
MGKDMVPKRMFFTKGVGHDRNKLTSFELALRAAGIETANLVRVSSIFPPRCKIISKKKGLAELSPGEVVFAVVAQEASNEPGRLISASVGLAVPADGDRYGYLSEHHAYGQTARESGDYAEDLAATMLASTLGVKFDPEKAYDERREAYRMSGQIINSAQITAASKGDANGRWTTCVAAAILLFD